jgi:ABC-type sulfate transport system permease subunit
VRERRDAKTASGPNEIQVFFSLVGVFIYTLHLSPTFLELEISPIMKAKSAKQIMRCQLI